VAFPEFPPTHLRTRHPRFSVTLVSAPGQRTSPRSFTKTTNAINGQSGQRPRREDLHKRRKRKKKISDTPRRQGKSKRLITITLYVIAILHSRFRLETASSARSGGTSGTRKSVKYLGTQDDSETTKCPGETRGRKEGTEMTRKTWKNNTEPRRVLTFLLTIALFKENQVPRKCGRNDPRKRRGGGGGHTRTHNRIPIFRNSYSDRSERSGSFVLCSFVHL